MKKIMLMQCFLLMAIHLSAQSKQEAAVASAVEKLSKAMIEADKASLEALTAEALSYGHSSGLVEDKQTFIEKIVSGKSDFETIVLSDQTIHVEGKTAIVRHILKAHIMDGGKPADVQIKIILVWVQQGKSWKLLARQAVRFQ